MANDASVAQRNQRDEQLAFQLTAVLAGAASLVFFAEREFTPVIDGDPIFIPRAFGIALALKPSSVPLWIAFWVTYVSVQLYSFPYNNTNQTLVFFLGLCALGSAAKVMFKARTWRVSGADLYRDVSPAFRVCFWVIYFWAIFHKLNWDFVKPTVSCATALTGQLFGRFAMHPSAALYAVPAVIMTLLTEGALAVGTFFRKTQRVTAVLGLGFHWLLGIAGFYGFSSTMMAFLPIFLFPLAGRAFANYEGRSAFGRLSKTTVNRMLLVLYVAVMVDAKYEWHIRPVWLGLKLWYFLPFVALFMWWNNRGAIGESILEPSPDRPVWWHILHPRLLYLIVLVHFLNGMSPYLGFKTEYSYAMYSNLRTEGGTTNHIVWSKPLSLAPYQRDLVYVLDGSDKMLADTLGGRPVERYVLADRVRRLARSGRTNIAVVFRDTLQTYTIAAAERDPAMMATPRFFERKLLAFRKITPPRTDYCEH